MTATASIVCGLDGTPRSRHTADVARHVAREIGARLVLVHVVPVRPPLPLGAVPIGPHPVAISHGQEIDRAELDAAFGVAGGMAEEPWTDAVSERGDVAAGLAAAAEADDARLIVVGTTRKGRAGAAVLGTAAVDLAADGAHPVMVVPPPDPARPHGALAPGPVVCGVDGSERAEHAARFAAELADDLHAELALVSVHPLETSRIEHARAAVRSAMRVGRPGALPEQLTIGAEDPAQALAVAAAVRRAALLVVGSRGRGSLRGALLGSVSASLTRHAGCPVVIVPTSASSGIARP